MAKGLLNVGGQCIGGKERESGREVCSQNEGEDYVSQEEEGKGGRHMHILERYIR